MTDKLLTRLLADATRPVTVDKAALRADPDAGSEGQTSSTSRVLSGIGGLFASLLFVVFLFLADILRESGVLFFTGAVLIVVTIALGRFSRGAFLGTLIVCGYLLGVVLLLIGASEGFSNARLSLLIAVVATVTIVAGRNYYLILLAVASLPGCLLFLHLTERIAGLSEAAVSLTGLALLLVSLSEHRLISDPRFSAARTGLVIGLAISLLWYRWGDWMSDIPLPAYRDFMVGCSLYALTLTTVLVSLGRRWAIGLGITILPLIFLPLLLGSLFILLVSYRSRHFSGIAMGVAGLLYFTAQYYYDLRWSLLDKSLILMASGILLLLAYYIFVSKISRHESS